ncbi:putative membrane protein [Exiguobacterium sp. S17]|nr:putative membrane protein [Exiguobacterium sp. S17]
MIWLVMAIGVGGKMGIGYGVMSIVYFIACFGAYMYVHTRAS